MKRVMLLLVFVVGCGAPGTPKGRIGMIPTRSHMGPNIGKHKAGEKNGIVYTKRAGHIDISHTRKSIDWTAYLYGRFLEDLSIGKSDLTFKMKEPSKYHLILEYPSNWNSLSAREKEAVSEVVALNLAVYCTYCTTTWHEMLTWWGWGCTGLSEKFSAFTWEENFSNLLGCLIGARAIMNTSLDYKEAVTLAFDEELEYLGIQSSKISRAASKKVKGEWYKNGLIFPKMIKRNLDIGFDDGFVTPSVVPMSGSGLDIVSYSIPSLKLVRANGFNVLFEIEPVIKKSRVRKVIGTDRVNPELHFQKIMEQIEREAVRQGMIP